MLKLISPQITPIGGYWFIDPDTKHNYGKHDSFNELSAYVSRYREQNNLPRIENFRMVWESFVCANTPQMRDKCCPVSADVKRRFSQYWSGAKAYVKAATQGDEAFVDQKEAEERAYICSICTNNVNNIGHRHSQFYTDKFIRSQIGKRKTTLDQSLYTCRECTCLLRSKVHYSDEVVAESLTQKEIQQLRQSPRNTKTGGKLVCWQLDSLTQIKKRK